MARKGNLKRFKNYNVAMNETMVLALEQSAERNERRVTEELRFAVRQYLKIDQAPAEDMAGVSA